MNEYARPAVPLPVYLSDRFSSRPVGAVHLTVPGCRPLPPPRPPVIEELGAAEPFRRRHQTGCRQPARQAKPRTGNSSSAATLQETIRPRTSVAHLTARAPDGCRPPTDVRAGAPASVPHAQQKDAGQKVSRQAGKVVRRRGMAPASRSRTCPAAHLSMASSPIASSRSAQRAVRPLMSS